MAYKGTAVCVEQLNVFFVAVEHVVVDAGLDVGIPLRRIPSGSKTRSCNNAEYVRPVRRVLRTGRTTWPHSLARTCTDELRCPELRRRRLRQRAAKSARWIAGRAPSEAESTFLKTYFGDSLATNQRRIAVALGRRSWSPFDHRISLVRKHFRERDAASERMRVRALWVIGIGLQLMAACGDAPASLGSAGGERAGRGSAGSGSGGRGSAAGNQESACSAPVGTPMTPRSVTEVVAMLNAMAKPVTLPCFIESLARPLALHATHSVLSAQPADGKRSPRLFVFIDPLIMSIVPDGLGRTLLEFGERRSETHSLKGELEFPITAELGPESPFGRLRYDDNLSTCDFCHGDATPAPDHDVPYARISLAMRPLPRERVTIEQVRAEAEACDAAEEPERCAMLHALFGTAPSPSEVEFPPTYRTFL